MKKHIIINVGRQLGSGGRIIGNRCLLYTSDAADE